MTTFKVGVENVKWAIFKTSAYHDGDSYQAEINFRLKFHNRTSNTISFCYDIPLCLSTIDSQVFRVLGKLRTSGASNCQMINIRISWNFAYTFLFATSN